jgi:predicted dehydrogenase
MSPIGLAVVGAGYWGPNLVRTALATPGFHLEWPCDLDEERPGKALGRYTMVRATDYCEKILADPAIGAVAIAAGPGRGAASWLRSR